MKDAKKFFKYVGNVLALLSIIFVVYAIAQMKVDLSSIQNWDKIIVIGILGCVICILSVRIMALAWHRILEYLAGEKIEYRSVYRIYTKANLGKYLPGNVMHYVERNIFAVQFGIEQAKIALSSLLEIVGQAAAACFLSVILSFGVLIGIIQKLFSRNVIVILMVLILFPLIAFIICIKKISKLQMLFIKLKKISFWKMFIVNLFLYMLALALLGMVMLMFVWALGNIPFQINDVKTTMSAYIVAWFLGFIVPGAPGGIGVREFVFSFMTEETSIREIVLLAAVVHRIITVFGDIISYILGNMVGGKNEPELFTE